MSLLTPAAAQAAGIGAELSEPDLQVAIDEEEAWLARRIGPLAGERTQRFPLAYLRPPGSVIHLQRPASGTIVVTDGGVDISTSAELRPGGWRVAYLPEATRWGGVVTIKYTPNDLLEVTRALKELLGLTLGTQDAGGLQSETMGSYSYQRGAGSVTRARHSIVRSLQEPAQPGNTRLRSSVRHGLAGALDR